MIQQIKKYYNLEEVIINFFINILQIYINQKKKFKSSSLLSHQVLHIDLQYIQLKNIIFIIINIFVYLIFNLFKQINNFYKRNYHHYLLIFVKTKIFQLFQLNFHFNFQLFIIHFLLFDIFSSFYAIKTYTQYKLFIFLHCKIFNYKSQFKTLQFFQFIRFVFFILFIMISYFFILCQFYQFLINLIIFFLHLFLQINKSEIPIQFISQQNYQQRQFLESIKYLFF
ncbi:transmembrane protein, putative (macronuclear) [Tetrahymena thermophila SB210]|uniref:Transmembrane protein, putative n=1 Tax=Tetrahymena thermophila (strain SB210) TaxID=312017 RepID=W7WXG5_TETTS|nr:transmembrane protein, putative [Tetrahymena thermophila SB210]EWS71495.1 transmembrane protein, putative [Tetrahymena thermophila SB210]|eukprot:XP_012655971.1 transmembrane protein, putative [Tetrahymena thermophila SB210]